MHTVFWQIVGMLHWVVQPKSGTGPIWSFQSLFTFNLRPNQQTVKSLDR